MEFIGRIFFPKTHNSSDEDSKDDNQNDDRDDDLYDEGSYNPRRIDLVNSMLNFHLYIFGNMISEIRLYMY